MEMTLYGPSPIINTQSTDYPFMITHPYNGVIAVIDFCCVAFASFKHLLHIVRKSYFYSFAM